MSLPDKKHIIGFLGILLTVTLFGACGDETVKTTPVPTARPTPLHRVTDTPVPTLTAAPTVTPTPTRIPDFEPPVISGAEDIQVKVNGTLSYTRNVTATDNSGETFSFRVDNPNLWVDTSDVKISVPGTYRAVYHAMDSAGNESTAEVTVLVSKASPDEVFAMADQVLDRIITEDMDISQKAEAIFDYVHKNIGYKNKKGSDYIESAYYGLEERLGDCNVYAATSRVLLTRAGIPNIEIHKYPEDGEPHVWNIVDLGDGWYHFDTTVWHRDTADADARDKGIFMWTTARLKSSGSGAVRRQHVFDASLYPEIQ